MKPMMILSGTQEEANYKDQVISDYRGNPLIEALPDILSAEEASRKLSNYPVFAREEKNLPAHLKMHCLGRLNRMVQPMLRHLELEQAISRALRQGYYARNILTPDYKRRLREINPLDPSIPLTGMRSSATSFSLIGVSGVGKSTAVEYILNTYPQVIRHYHYHGIDCPFTQVVWLKLECPHDGSLRGFCINFLDALDSVLETDYRKQYASGRPTTNELLPKVASLAITHGMGILVIDEIQNLSTAKSGGSDLMLNFFVQLVNTIGLPVLLIGTPRAEELIMGQLREARRASGEGAFFWDRLDFVNDWPLLVSTLWEYQWTAESCEMTQSLSELLFFESQGITDIAVKLYVLSQWRAINDEESSINEAVIRKVVKENFRLVKPMLDALKSRNINEIEKYDDLPVDWKQIYQSAGMSSVSQDRKLLEIGRDGLKDITNAMVDYLLQAGIGQIIAHRAVTEVLKKARNENIKTLNAQAIQLAFQLQAH